MKKTFRKLALAFAAASTVTVIAGASAMAADITASYDADNNSIPVALPSGAAEGTQATVLILPTDKKSAVTDADVLYIAQSETSSIARTALLKGRELADGTYSVLVGYYDSEGKFNIAEDTFVVGTPAGNLREILIGDVNKDKEVDNIDAQQILRHAVGFETAFANDADGWIAADVNADDERDNIDAQQVLRYSVYGSGNTNAGRTALVSEDGVIVEWK